jgi:putative nucleotidyltransferase with HDIG domain
MAELAAAAPSDAPPKDPNALITAVASAATAALVLSAPGAFEAASARPLAFLAFVGITVLLQVVAVPVYNRGSISFAGTGLLALGFSFGAGAAIAVAILMGVVSLVVRRGRFNRGVFDAAQWALATGAGVAVYHGLSASGNAMSSRFGAAILAGTVAMLVNLGLLSFAMSLAEGTRAIEVWRERFRWFTPYYLASGPLAFALAVAHEELGLTGVLAFALPPVFMMISVRQYLARTRAAVEEVRVKNTELEAAVAQLAARNDDLRELLAFSGGLAARAHDRGELVAYAESALGRLTGAGVTVSADEAEGLLLSAGGHAVGSVVVTEAIEDPDRWTRLSEVILPQLATAIESAELVDQVRKTHLATIAALSRSMEAKDYYTGGHTERVSDVAVALARHLGYAGADLDALEIGALLHDIGKIGIPERILHKPGPLDEDEWKVMKEHPIISEYILSGVDLPGIVLHIARHSHESFDGSGYPDGLRGEDIPLPARIVLVADAFDALTSDRPYRRGRHVAAAMDEIREHSGTQFCPRVVAALEAVYRAEPHLLGAAGLRAVEVA